MPASKKLEEYNADRLRDANRKRKLQKTLMENGQDKAFVESMWGMKEHFWTDKLIKARSCKKKMLHLLPYR